MGVKENQQVMFNAAMLRNKRELIESLEDFMRHYKEPNAEEDYSEEQRAVILDICGKFLDKIKNADIPEVIRPFCCYEYNLKHDGMFLARIQYSDITFNDNGWMESATIISENMLIKVTCDYLSVNEYARLSGVTDITVRQWIRRGKLRTAKKFGREWKIPALSAPPKRGYEPATYIWRQLSETIQSEFPFLPVSGRMELFQDKTDKKCFHARVYDDSTNEGQSYQLSASDCERLELKLISEDDIEVESFSDFIMFVPEKRNSSLPYLANDPLDCDDVTIIVRQDTLDEVWFAAKEVPGNSYYDGEPENYIMPIEWVFYSNNPEEAMSSYDDDLKDREIARFSGSFIFINDIQKDGWNPIVLCDDLDGDLGYLMDALYSMEGPLYFANGGSHENVLYIHELNFSGEELTLQMCDRLLRELPWICKRLMHVFPEIISYCVAVNESVEKTNILRNFYMKNGFCQIGDTNILYAYTE